MFSELKTKMAVTEAKAVLKTLSTVIGDPEIQTEMKTLVIELIKFANVINREGNKLSGIERAAIRKETRDTFHAGVCPRCGSDEVSLDNDRFNGTTYVCNMCGENLTLTTVDCQKLNITKEG